MEPTDVPPALKEVLEHCAATFREVEEVHLAAFNQLRTTQESTATHIVATHEPLYKAKALLVQLVKDLNADDTQKMLAAAVASAAAAAPYQPGVTLVSHAFLHACTLLSSIMLKAAETAEAYRWCYEALRLIERMQADGRSALSADEFRAIDPAKIAKYVPAPMPHFFTAASKTAATADAASTGGSACTAMAMELLLLACQVWTTWSDPDNVRTVAEAAERLAKRLPERKPANSSGSGSDAVSPASSPTTTGAAAAAAADAGTRVEMAKAQQQEADAARAVAEGLERKRQEEAAAIKLLQRRAAKFGEKIAVFVAPPWFAPFVQTNVQIGARGAEAAVATSPSLWAKGDIESRAFVDARQLDTITCVVQAYKGNSNNAVSCFYAHRALEFRLPGCVAALAEANRAKAARAAANEPTSSAAAAADASKQEQLDEWIGLCLSLAEFYLEERDLSHCGHCLDVCEALMTHRGAAAGATSSISTYKGYKTPNGVMLRLLRLRLVSLLLKLFIDALEEQEQRDPAAAASPSGTSNVAFKDTTACSVQLFQNPLLLPEEFNFAASEQQSRQSGGAAGAAATTTSGGSAFMPPNWKSKHVDTTRRLNLLDKVDDPSLEALVARPPSAIAITGRSVRELTQARLGDYQESLIPQLLAALDVNEDCERFVQSRRAVNEFYAVAFRITRSPVLGERRLKVLAELRECALHETVFRNVLRQAEFDFATQSIALADLVTKEQRRPYYEQADAALLKFCGAFEKEIAAAKREGVAVTLEGSDFVAYALGMMRRSEVLLKLEQLKACEEVCKTLVEFAGTFAKDGGEQLAEMKGLAAELYAVLTGTSKEKAASTADVAKKVAASTAKKTVTTATSRYADPNTKGKK